MHRVFTLSDLKKSKVAHLNMHHFVEVNSMVKKGKKEDPVGLMSIIEVLDRLKIPFVKEHRFHEIRRFRFDAAVLYIKVGIEYEGLMSKKSRHTTAKGYTTDTEKYNLAQSLGWRILRYTALNYKDFECDLLKIIGEL